MKTTEYLDHFARFKRKENVEAVERLLSAHKELAKFERAQLGMSLQSTLAFYYTVLACLYTGDWLYEIDKNTQADTMCYRFTMLR